MHRKVLNIQIGVQAATRQASTQLGAHIQKRVKTRLRSWITAFSQNFLFARKQSWLFISKQWIHGKKVLRVRKDCANLKSHTALFPIKLSSVTALLSISPKVSTTWLAEIGNASGGQFKFEPPSKYKISISMHNSQVRLSWLQLEQSPSLPSCLSAGKGWREAQEVWSRQETTGTLTIHFPSTWLAAMYPPESLHF